MDNERILWASPKKRVRQSSGASTGQSTTTSARKNKIQAETNLEDTNYDVVAQLEFSPEVAALMSSYEEAAGLAICSDQIEKQGKLLRSSAQSGQDSTSTSKSSSHIAIGTITSGIESANLSPIPLPYFAPNERPLFDSTTSTSGAVTLGSALSGPASLSLSSGATATASSTSTSSASASVSVGVADKYPAHWSYNGVSFLPACYSSHHPSSSSSSSSSISFSSFTPTVRPIPCTPLNPWYLSNGTSLTHSLSQCVTQSVSQSVCPVSQCVR